MKVREVRTYTFDRGERLYFTPGSWGVVVETDGDPHLFLSIHKDDLDYWISELIRVKAKLDKEVA